MKTIIYELFSGVGFCNQLFSLETAIYLANITNRKLILLVKYPLCHCGTTSWEYGKFLEFFSDEYKQYLPHGIDVYYKQIPAEIKDIINSKKCITIPFISRFSAMVIVDPVLSIPTNQESIKNFCNHRKPYVSDLSMYNEEYIHTNKSNASRCFYNFFTTEKNYILMSAICKSLTILHNNFTNLDVDMEQPYIAIHLRLGDVKHDKKHIDTNSVKHYNNIKKQINNIYNVTDDKKNLVIMCDRNDGQILELLSKDFDIQFTDDLIKSIDYKNSFKNIKKKMVIEFLIQKKICENAQFFIGTIRSTVSNYIQYMHYIQNKTFTNIYTQKTIDYNNTQFNTWNKNKKTGPGISWLIFWPDNIFTI